MKKMKIFRNNVVFIISVLISVLVIMYGFFYNDTLNLVSGIVMNWVSLNFGWLYVLFVAFLCFFLLWLSLSKYGNIKLGDENSKPEYSNFSWYSMLFCGGTGIGLVFWSIAEPLSHYVSPPDPIFPGSLEAANFSIRTCFLHWGITQWVWFRNCRIRLGLFSIFERIREDRLAIY